MPTHRPSFLLTSCSERRSPRGMEGTGGHRVWRRAGRGVPRGARHERLAPARSVTAQATRSAARSCSGVGEPARPLGRPVDAARQADSCFDSLKRVPTVQADCRRTDEPKALGPPRQSRPARERVPRRPCPPREPLRGVGRVPSASGAPLEVAERDLHHRRRRQYDPGVSSRIPPSFTGKWWNRGNTHRNRFSPGFLHQQSA